MSKIQSYDALARDVAMEINLGGFRLDKEDLAAVLEGMSRKNLDTLRERVLYHSKDFFGLPFDCNNYERLAEFSSFAERECDEWFKGIRSQEDLGLEKASGSLADEVFNEDRGKYFLFSCGAVRRCTKATRSIEWGDDGLKYVMEVPENKVPKALASLLLSSAGENRMKGREVDFVTYFSLPEGRVDKLRDVNNEGHLEFVLEDGKSVSFNDIVIDFMDLIIPVLQDELDEQRCRLYNKKIASDNRKELFIRKADMLIDSFGKRVASDFLYDQIELHPFDSSSGEKMFVRRSTYYPLQKKTYYVVFIKPEGGSVVSNLDILTPTESSFCIEAMDREMELQTKRQAFCDGIHLENGPKVFVPTLEIPDGTVTVQDIFLSQDGDLMVSGLPGGAKDSKSVTFPMSWLTDKGIDAVKRSTDLAVSRLLAEQYPRPDLGTKKSADKSAKIVRGIE